MSVAPNTQTQIQAHLANLPQSVRDAVTSVNIAKQLQTLAQTHKLHVDQWQTLENEVTLTLLGFKPGEQLEETLMHELGIDENTAAPLVDDISRVIFIPIREELERELGHPLAKEEKESEVEKIRDEVLSQERTSAAKDTPPPPTPGTPPAPPPEEKAARGPAAGAYKPGEASTTRKSVEDDPYREAVR